jgi:hypothetical protein
MLQINESPNKRNFNAKLLISAFASTAVIGSASLFLLSKNNNNKSNGSNFLNNIPDNFSGDFNMSMYSDYDFYGYTAVGKFNKVNDEHGEWSVEAVVNADDKRNKRKTDYYLKDDRFFVGTNDTMDCLPPYKQIGYAQLKYAILNGVEVNKDQIDSTISKRSEKICSGETKNIVIESEDYGTLLICLENNNGHLNGGVFGREFDLSFKSTSKAHDIKVPMTKGKGFFIDNENNNKGCKKSDKFQTVGDFDSEMHKELGGDYKFQQPLDNFPFTERKLSTQWGQVENVKQDKKRNSSTCC